MRRHSSPVVDPAVVAKVAQGDRRAFAELYELTSSLLFALAKKILDETDEATELLQEVYVEIWQKAHQYDPGRGSPLSWMVTLTRSRAIDRRRTKKWKSRNLTQPLEEQGEGVEITSPSNPFEAVANQELRKQVGEALGILPKEQSVALTLSYYEGLSHREIASRLNEPVGTIKTRIRLAVIKLREMLHSYGTQESS